MFCRSDLATVKRPCPFLVRKRWRITPTRTSYSFYFMDNQQMCLRVYFPFTIFGPPQAHPPFFAVGTYGEEPYRPNVLFPGLMVVLCPLFLPG
ncbi:hypothetical protein HMPREF0083_05825 [Aneurinibacillus aneurinilyticus ATCC 12856]|uniref:Uncharacterized protein n=1 Tax=Aneurinibacillus aneurinilyticus ATCC 12856 TaxID=649747 RepID=U1W973_ANEAE|nr:hypothetical protein HMPREF0083_05825 [Aneurinibacillus aneurinilyticus ATCC 12856]